MQDFLHCELTLGHYMLWKSFDALHKGFLSGYVAKTVKNSVHMYVCLHGDIFSVVSPDLGK